MFLDIYCKNTNYISFGQILFLKDAEDGGAAAGHRGVEGAAAVHLLFEGGDGRVEGKDRGLEVVDDKVSPLLDRVPHRFPKVGPGKVKGER